MRSLIIAAAAACILAGCSEEAPPPPQEHAALTPGEYEISWTVAELRSTDLTTPATKLSQDATGTSSNCVTDTEVIDPVLFAEAGDECTALNSYARKGRINLQLSCKRPGDSGQVMLSVNGTSTADSLEGEISTTTYLAGQGDYAMKRSFTGRRTGECPPAAEEEAAL